MRTLLAEFRDAAARRVSDEDPDAPPPTLVLPVDQAEEPFRADVRGAVPFEGPDRRLRVSGAIAELANPDADGQSEPVELNYAAPVDNEDHQQHQRDVWRWQLLHAALLAMTEVDTI